MDGSIPTKEIMAKEAIPLSNRQKYNIRLEKLKDLESNGLLAEIKSRQELAEMIGFTKEESSCGNVGYTFISNMIYRGRLEENPTDGGFILKNKNTKKSRVSTPQSRAKRNGLVRYGKLELLKSEGKLEKIRNRGQLYSLLVNTKDVTERRRVGLWCRRAIEAGYIKEKKYYSNGRKYYSYSLNINLPTEKTMYKPEQVTTQKSVAQVKEAPLDTPKKTILISKGDLSVAFSGLDDQVTDLIVKLFQE